MQSTGYELTQLFADGGLFMYPLILCSLFALGVIIAKAIMLYAARQKSEGVLDRVTEHVERGDVGGATRIVEETPGPVAAILLAVLRRVGHKNLDDDDLEKAVKTTGVIELGFLERGLTVLATVSNVAPLLGFLGTVAGMIQAFASIEQAGQIDAALVAGGIKVALITTATGLAIAIPVNVAYNYFVSRIDKLIMDMESGSARVLNLIWNLNRRGTGGMAPAGGTAGGGTTGSSSMGPDAGPAGDHGVTA